MDRVHVKGSLHIASVGYDRGKMQVSFHNGDTHEFTVPEHVHEGLMGARSKGEYFHRFVKPKYQGVKL